MKSAKADQCESNISESFEKALHFLQDESLKLIEVEKKFGVADTSDDILQRLNFYFYEIMFEWANQKPFIEVVKLNNIDEGTIIRMVNSVERIC
jgi:superfamily II RNA helicase